MVSGNDINTFFTMYNPVISGIAEICGILGFIGSIVLSIVSYILKKRADKADKKLNEYQILINDLKADNAQIAKTINNYGLSLSDTKVAAADVFDEKAKNLHNIHMQDKEPDGLKSGDIWISGDVDIDFGNIDEE